MTNTRKYTRKNTKNHSKKHSKNHSKKHSKNHSRRYSKKHKYFINRCKFDELTYLNHTILEKYLAQLECVPDRTMTIISDQDKRLAKKHKISYKDFCFFTKKINPPNIKNSKISNIMRADIFFYNINSGFLDKRLYPFKKYLANVLNIDFANITNKGVIYDNILNVAPDIASKYFIKTFPINQIKEYKFPGWYILRPNSNYGGADIKYISSKKELTTAIEYYKKHKNFKGILYGDNVIASIYLEDLLLFKGKKMHLRMYYLVSCLNGTISSFLLDDDEIITAAEPFDMDRPFTKAKHDTHFQSTGADLTIKKDFTTENIGVPGIEDKWNDIYKRCQNMCSGITKMIISKTNGNILYENQRNGYYIFGLDVFITKDLEPVLIECNEKPGFGTFTIKGNLALSHKIYRWINSVILEPLLKYDKPMPMKAREHKTYIHLD
jgi:hypothetical protein